jgi:hypothetical protein
VDSTFRNFRSARQRTTVYYSTTSQYRPTKMLLRYSDFVKVNWIRGKTPALEIILGLLNSAPSEKARLIRTLCHSWLHPNWFTKIRLLPMHLPLGPTRTLPPSSARNHSSKESRNSKLRLVTSNRVEKPQRKSRRKSK